MNVNLYNHQKLAIERLNSGNILAGGVGSGKSLTALVYYYTKICKGTIKLNGVGKSTPMQNPKDLYIITTVKKRDSLDWEKECASIGLANLDDLNNVKLVVDSWYNISKYENIEKAFFIFDEQRLVGSGKWVRSFLKITKKNQWILLSATPGDTWLDYSAVFIANGFFNNRTEFIRRHVEYEPYSKFPLIRGYRGTGTLNKYRSSILVPMEFERNTSRHRVYLSVDYDKTLLDKVIKSRWDIFEDEPISTPSKFLHTTRKVVNSDMSRILAVKEILDSKKKVIVFYNYKYELDLLLSFFSNYNNLKIAQWNGTKHEPLPTSNYWIYLVQYTAGAEGWNCTSTDTIIFYSLNYSYKILEQCEGRIDRLNTDYKDLYYYYLKSSSNIDNAILRSIKQKKIFNEKAFFELIYKS